MGHSSRAVAMPKRRLPRNTWRNALRVAVNRRDEKGVKYLDVIARKVVEMAVEGHMGAINELGSRLDGRQFTLTGDDDAPGMAIVTRIERVIVDPNPNILRDITNEVTIEQQREDTASPSGESVPPTDRAA